MTQNNPEFNSATDTQAPEQPKGTPATVEKDEDSSSIWDDILGWVSLLFAIPLFLILARILPDLDWKWNLDRWLLGFAVFAIVYMLMQWVKWISILGIIFSIGFLTYGSFAKGNHYGWKNAVFDYKSIVYACAEEAEPIEYISNLLSVKQRTEIVSACDYNSPSVVEFARNCIANNTEFKSIANEKECYDYRRYIQACAIFKEINNNWDYAGDPLNRDFFAKASSSAGNLTGDCDCHAIFMASCLKAIGVDARIALTYNHAYPEMGIDSKDWDNVKYLIMKVLFHDESKGKTLNYHKEGDKYWLNMDYTDTYPGGSFMDNTPDKVMVINI